MDAGPWNWLEVTKIAMGLVTPLALAGLGIYLNRLSNRFEHLQWRSQKLIEKRLVVYDDLSPDFNDLLCYFTYVGCWRDLDPPAVIALKRSIDKRVHLAAPLFSPAFFEACMHFQNLCFETYSGWGRDALLRTAFIRRKESRPNDWDPHWDVCFSEQTSDPHAIRFAYGRVMEAFAQDVGVHATFAIPPSGTPPANVL